MREFDQEMVMPGGKMVDGTEPEWLKARRDGREQPAGGPAQKLGSNNGVYLLSRDWKDTSESTITKDYAFNRHTINDGEHVSPFDNGKVQIGADGIEVVLVQGIDEDAFKRTLSAATRATIGIDIGAKWELCTKMDNLGRLARSEDYCDVAGKHSMASGHWEHFIDPLDDNQDWEEMLRGGLQTALETQTIVFAVKGASRTATHQLVRSRRAAFHQQSQRASYMGDLPECRMPESVWKNITAREAFLKAMISCHEAYQVICEQDVSYQDARFILPEGTCNFILLEYPVREFLNVYAYRACSMFQWEIVSIVRKAREVLVDKHPWIAPYVKISCQSGPCDCGGVASCAECFGTGMVGNKCTFQGWEDVEGQCDFPWATHENRTFKPIFHRIGRRPADA